MPDSNTAHTVELSAGLLSYRQWGVGEPVLCLHGLADHGLVWRALAESLRSSYRCIAPDLPGHGDSAKPVAAQRYASRSLVSILEEFATALKLQTLHIVAHSWSAKLALIWARQCPSRISSLFLVDPFFVNRFPAVFRLSFPLLYRLLPFLKMLGPFPTFDDAQNTARTLKQYRGWSSLQQEVFRASLEQKPDGTWGSKFTAAARNGVFLDILQQSGLRDTLQTQAYILVPEKGLNRTAWQIKPYLTFLPNVEIQAIPGNHWPHLVEPSQFNQAILGNLSRARAT